MFTGIMLQPKYHTRHQENAIVFNSSRLTVANLISLKQSGQSVIKEH